jgi:hypothetical protein
MPSAVSGLTNDDAASTAATPSGTGMHMTCESFVWVAYIEPLTPETVAPSSACASGDDPAATTVPAPSLPHGIGCPTRAAFMAMAAGLNVPTRAPSTDANDSGSAPAMSMPRSDGLMGAASTATTTSSRPGSGIGSVSIAMRTVPSSVTVERTMR